MEANITGRKRRRIQREGRIYQQSRWVVSWNIDIGPSQRFFETRVEAVEFRNRLLTNAEPARPSNTTLSATRFALGFLSEEF
jgi:hypothetical protein